MFKQEIYLLKCHITNTRDKKKPHPTILQYFPTSSRNEERGHPYLHYILL